MATKDLSTGRLRGPLSEDNFLASLLLRGIEEGTPRINLKDERSVRRVLEATIERAIDYLNQLDGDPDLEIDPFNEGEPAFDPKSREMVSHFPDCDPDADREGPSWLERIDQDSDPLPNKCAAFVQNAEDAEDDDPAEQDDHGGGNIEDEPHDDFGEAEPEEGEIPPQYGIDQRITPTWPTFGNRAWDGDRDGFAGGSK